MNPPQSSASPPYCLPIQRSTGGKGGKGAGNGWLHFLLNLLCINKENSNIVEDKNYYMDTSAHAEDVTRFSQCPVPDKQRRRTDIFCVICPALFALIMFIVACATFNNYNLKQMTYYIDGEGSVCGFEEKVVNYPFVYFTSVNDPTKRLCVSKCPKAGDTKLDCYPTEKLACSANTNPDFEVQIYDSEQEINRIGGICMPTDPALKTQVKQISHLESKYTFLSFYDAIWDAMWISALFGIVLIVLLQCMTRKIVHWIFILGSLTFIALGITIFIVPDGFLLYKIVGGLVFLFMGFLAGYSVIKQDYRQEIFICGRLFQIAAQIVSENWWILGLILIWLFLECCLIALMSFQMLSAWSIGPLTFEPESPFLRVTAFISGFLSFFIFIEFFWGLSFLKQSFNFVVSGYATQWYCYRKEDNYKSKLKIYTSFSRLIKYHWGSVAGGSLLLCIFYFVDLFIDFFSSSDTSVPPEISSKITVQPFKREVLERRGCRGLFDLMRSQSFGYINLISIPYCNASRYCEMLADDSRFYDRSQTTNRLYRICAHITIMMIATLIAFAGNKYTDDHPGVIGVFFVAIVSLFTVTYFISLHGDLAQGILVSVFIEERLNQMDPAFNQGDAFNVTGAPIVRPPKVVQDLHEDDLAGAYDQSTIMQYLKAHVDNRRDASRGNVGGQLAINDRF